MGSQPILRRRLTATLTATLTAALALILSSTPNATALGSQPLPPSVDSFYRYDGAQELADIPSGTVLKTRERLARFAMVPAPVPMTQLLYKTETESGSPLVTVASVLHPTVAVGTPRLVAYQSFYDSLTTDCEPSYVLNGAFDRGGLATLEQPLLANLVSRGYTVVVSDFEGQDPAFAIGPRHGRATLDGIRATFNSAAVGLPATTKVALAGYSGGALATEWASELAPTYAPDVNRRLVGSAFGGTIVNPRATLGYIDGTPAWSGVIPLSLIGVSRSYGIALEDYLSAYGKQVLSALQNACIFDAVGHYPGLTFAQLMKPQYSTPERIPGLSAALDALTMGRGATPTVPMLMVQGTLGEVEGTLGGLSFANRGDGVALTSEARDLVRRYRAAGASVDYRELTVSHNEGGTAFLNTVESWLAARFAG